MTIYQLSEDYIFPNPVEAEPEGLLAIGGDLSPNRILLAYSMGIFPWYSADQPILWWSPDPRLLLNPQEFHISKSLRRILRSDKFTVRFDTQFNQVVRLCAETPREGQDGTWITEEMIEAYFILHQLGYAHSIESYYQGELVGGLYGISLGKAFFGESMFSLRPDASKVAIATLSKQLTEWDFSFIDCQIPTSHLKSLGAFEVDRSRFLQNLDQALEAETLQGHWKKDQDLQW
ncbi:MAG: leucyl/phenylalanyl-tRNA--protein transferase [SAR324 cluster bacterium]|uniref:Leucyl/phenylalanyl-tRNA--protein transferase n=1 Tax=SAR324 cluster bacterium TaxID=2024889 RepID=A0A2A4SSI1_9DELT|nr:MAG: leucyl/phenylalanyl-tRNA--protein transferase [SAR324 cluster bacterium]